MQPPDSLKDSLKGSLKGVRIWLKDWCFCGCLVLSHGMCIWSWFKHWSVTMGYTGVPPKIAISLCNRWLNIKIWDTLFSSKTMWPSRWMTRRTGDTSNPPRLDDWYIIYPDISSINQMSWKYLQYFHIYVWKRIEKYLQNIFRILLEDWLSISCSVHLGLAPWILEMDCCGSRLSQVSHHWLWVRMKHSNLHDMISRLIIQLKFVGMVIPISWCSFFWRWSIFQTRRWWEDE